MFCGRTALGHHRHVNRHRWNHLNPTHPNTPTTASRIKTSIKTRSALLPAKYTRVLSARTEEQASLITTTERELERASLEAGAIQGERLSPCHHQRLRPDHPESTGSRQISQRQAGLGRGSTRNGDGLGTPGAVDAAPFASGGEAVRVASVCVFCMEQGGEQGDFVRSPPSGCGEVCGRKGPRQPRAPASARGRAIARWKIAVA
jgi:hypothetical protein